MNRVITGLAALAALSALLAFGMRRASDAEPETVLITFYPRQGAQRALADVIAEHWAVARRLGIVRDSPHVTLRGRDGARRPYFVEVLTWRDARVPDDAPDAIVELWDRMNALVESRDGRPGLSFEVMAVLPSPVRSAR